MESDDDDLRLVLTGLMARLDRMEDLLATVNQRTTAVLGEVWSLRYDVRQPFGGEDRRRPAQSGG